LETFHWNPNPFGRHWLVSIVLGGKSNNAPIDNVPIEKGIVALDGQQHSKRKI
jgi:hypothetical protein